MNKIKIIFFACLITSTFCYSQTQAKIFSVGDKVPDEILKSLNNYTSRTGKITDFKGKYLVLDFWNRWCASCIASFPKMQKFQQDFDDKLQIFLVTDDKPKDLEKLFQNSPIVKSTNLPFIIGDSLLHSLFPHKVVPYQVWIDKNGVIKAMTDGYNATAITLDKFLRDRNLDIEVRKDDITFDKWTYFTWTEDKNVIRNSRFYSAITGRNVATGTGGIGWWAESGSNNIIGIRGYNSTIAQLYKFAYNGVLLENRPLILQVQQPELYNWPDDPSKIGAWKDKYLFGYDLFMPNNSMELLQKVMIEDLDHYFSIKSSLETVKFKCWVVSALKNVNVETKGGETIEEYTEDRLTLKNNTVSSLVSYMKYANKGQLVVIDETGVTKRIDVDIIGSLKDFNAIKKEFERHGLDLKEEERNIEAIVLKEN